MVTCSFLLRRRRPGMARSFGSQFARRSGECNACFSVMQEAFRSMPVSQETDIIYALAAERRPAARERSEKNTKVPNAKAIPALNICQKLIFILLCGRIAGKLYIVFRSIDRAAKKNIKTTLRFIKMTKR